jgi:hypothetical protein
MPGPTKGVAFALATYANQDGTSIFPGNERLAAVTCQGDKTVRRALDWLRAGYLIERTRKGSSLGRKALADEYRLVIPSDLLTRHTVLDPDETPVRQTAVRGRGKQELRSDSPGTAVAQSGTAVAQSKNGGPTDRPPTHYHPVQDQDQRDDSVEDVTTRGAGDLYAQLVRIDELAARRRKGA